MSSWLSQIRVILFYGAHDDCSQDMHSFRTKIASQFRRVAGRGTLMHSDEKRSSSSMTSLLPHTTPFGSVQAYVRGTCNVSGSRKNCQLSSTELPLSPDE
uniref:Uncharacterized protein n=1 Tax=Bionectria ochroleuca TaxID=29856 RepID=A0A8H7NA82_BIOOC